MGVTYPVLRAEMARRGDTLDIIGDILGLSPPSLSRRFSGDIDWRKAEIDLLCERYNMPYEDLFKND